MARPLALPTALSLALAACAACRREPPPQPPAPAPAPADGFGADHAAAVAANPPGVSCRLRVDAAPGKRFALEGEVIPIALEFSSTTPGVHSLAVNTYDRSGRMWSEAFHVDPREGVADPLADYFGTFTGGFGGLTQEPPKLDAKPTAVRLTLNEHFRFMRPGEYRLYITSKRTDPPCTSDIVELTLAPDPAWAAKELERIRAVLAGASARGLKAAGYDESEETWRARDGLRFLGTHEAASEIVDQLCEGSVPVPWYAEAGIYGAPDRAYAIALLRRGLAAPGCAVGPDYLRTLTKLDAAPALPALLAGIPAKAAPARAISLRAAIHQLGEGPRNVPPDPRLPALRADLAAVFGALPEDSLERALSADWHEARTPALAPALLALASEARPRGRKLRSLSDLALERLLEIDPAAGRRFVLGELARPGGCRVAFTGATLSRLPDAELPDLDAAFLAGMRAEEHDGATLELRAEVTARYASKAVLRDVWALYLASSSFRVSLLSYLLRHDRKAAEAEILRKDDLHFAQRLAHFGWNRAVERVIAGRIAKERSSWAVDIVKELGGPTAEAALVEQLRALHEAGADEDPVAVRLVRAIGVAKGWVMPPAKLREVAALTGAEGKREIGFLLDRWGADGKHADLVLWSRGAPETVTGWIAQYDVGSLADVRAKIEQMPAGTALVWGTKAEDVDAEIMDQVRVWAKARGIEVVASKESAPGR